MICGSSGPKPGQRVKHDHPVGHLRDGLHVVGHDDSGRLLRLLGLEDQLVDHVAHDRVEPGGGLVVEHDLRVRAPGPGPARRASAARRRARPASCVRGPPGRPDLLKPLGDDLRELLLVADVVLAQAEGDVVVDRQAVEQRGHLEQEAEPEPQLDQLLAPKAGDVPAVEPDRARRRMQAGR